MTKIKNNIQILSIHIPKTAGSSFQKSLETIYGEGMMRLDFSYNDSILIAKNQTSQKELDVISEKGLNDRVTVLHGHIHYSDFVSSFEIHPELKVITWLRDPIDRVVSNYNYLRERFQQETNLSPIARKLFNRLVMSLTDFARLPRDIHMYRDYLNGIELQDVDFVGIVDHYDDDLQRLGTLLNWASVPSFHINKTTSKNFKPNENELSELMSICKEGMDIYNLAVELRNDQLMSNE